MGALFRGPRDGRARAERQLGYQAIPQRRAREGRARQVGRGRKAGRWSFHVCSYHLGQEEASRDAVIVQPYRIATLIRYFSLGLGSEGVFIALSWHGCS